jgi:hypothetical protein
MALAASPGMMTNDDKMSAFEMGGPVESMAWRGTGADTRWRKWFSIGDAEPLERHMTSAQRRKVKKYAAEHGITFDDACKQLGVETTKGGYMLRWFEGLGAAARRGLVLDAFQAVRDNDAWEQAFDLGRQSKTLEVHTTVFEDGTERNIAIHVKMPGDGNESAVKNLLDGVESRDTAFRSSIAYEGDLAVPAMFAEGAYEEAGKYYMLGVRDMGMDAILFRIERFDTKPDLLD